MFSREAEALPRSPPPEHQQPLVGGLAFYYALEMNYSAVKVLGDDALRTIARELVDLVERTPELRDRILAPVFGNQPRKIAEDDAVEKRLFVISTQRHDARTGVLESEDFGHHLIDLYPTVNEIAGEHELVLRKVAWHLSQELVVKVRSSVTINWTIRENVRAKIRVAVRRILRQYGFPPDKAERATRLVFEQAEALSAEWETA